VTGTDEEALDEVEQIWLTDDLEVGVSVEQVSRTPGAVTAFIDGVAVTTSVASGELELAGAAPCVPGTVVEPVR
jgi:hypothetical protein